MKLKKLLSIILSILLLAAVIPLVTFTASAENEEIFTFTISNNEATITGLIDNNTTGNLVIPEIIGGYSVTSIGAGAFYGCSGITDLYIPKSIRA